MRCVAALVGVVLAAVLATGCQSGRDRVPATPRGLAAAVLTHLDDRAVVSLGGSGADGVIYTTVEVDLDGLSNVVVFVTEDLPAGPPACEAVRGTQLVDCSTEPALRQITAGSPLGADGPVLVGEVRDDERRMVQVMLYGRDTAENRDLVAEVLDDPLVGVRTSVELNAAGEELERFDSSVLRLE